MKRARDVLCCNFFEGNGAFVYDDAVCGSHKTVIESGAGKHILPVVFGIYRTTSLEELLRFNL